jgi:transposase-like protein
MTKRVPRRWTAEQKLAIITEARQAGQSISEVCRRHQLSPGVFYTWERLAQQGALEALRGRRTAAPDTTVAQLQADLDRYRAVVAELSAENLQLKKGRWP